jgi:hypothetical protein
VGVEAISRNRTSSHSTPVTWVDNDIKTRLKIVVVNASSTPVDLAAPRSTRTRGIVDMMAKSDLRRAPERPSHV